MRKVGFVEINSTDTAAKCEKCLKSIAYQQPMSSKMFKEILSAFIRKHEKCEG